MSTLKYSHILIPALMLLSACGGGSSGCTPSDGRPLDTTTDTSGNCADTRAANSIRIGYPSTDAIEQLEGGPTAIYSKKGTAVVTDQNSNPVPDDTVVQLDVLDTLIARGTILAGDTISGSTLTDNAGILQGDGTTPTALNTAVVTRDFDPSRGIIAGDIVILFNAAASDRIRYVASVTANSITVSTPYINSYPSAIYPNAVYFVGEALVGTSILGTDEAGANKTSGVSKTKNGTASFRLEYFNNLLGYGASSQDTRFFPLGSTQVWVLANVGGSVATANQTSFSAIAPAVLTVTPSTIAASQDVGLLLLDANSNAIPFVSISGTSDTAGSSATTCITDTTGACDSTVIDGGTATITFVANRTSATATLTVN